MKKISLILTIVITLLLNAFMTGCGSTEESTQPPPTIFLGATPPMDSEIPVKAVIVLIFDKIPTDVIVSSGSTVFNTITVSDIIDIADLEYLAPSIRIGDDVLPSADLTIDGVNIGDGRTAALHGRILVVRSTFNPGPLQLKVVWADGVVTLRYIVNPDPP